MKNLFEFILFIIYTILIFFIDNLIVLICMFLLNFILALILKIKFKSIFNSFKLFFPFILFTFILNCLLDSLEYGIIMGFKITICYNITYIFSKTLTVLEISDVIQKLCYPLKIFRVNTNNIGIMVSISICMIPVLKDEITALIKAMKCKGKLLKIHSIIIIMRPMLISIFRRTSQMEKTLISKAYIE